MGSHGRAVPGPRVHVSGPAAQPGRFGKSRPTVSRHTAPAASSATRGHGCFPTRHRIVLWRTVPGARAEQLPWTAESPYQPPVAVWRERVERNSRTSLAALHAGDTQDPLARYRARHRSPPGTRNLEALLASGS